MIFAFTLRYLYWLRRVPLAPQIFDTAFLIWAAAFDRERLAAMEALEIRALEIPGVTLCPHHLGGIGFMMDRFEFAHCHGNGLLDVRLTRQSAATAIARHRAEPHHRFPQSAWVSFHLRSRSHLKDALDLLALGAAQRHTTA